jgi:hypothetical protein
VNESDSKLKATLKDRDFGLKERYGEKNGLFYGVLAPQDAPPSCMDKAQGTRHTVGLPMQALCTSPQEQGYESVAEEK